MSKQPTSRAANLWIPALAVVLGYLATTSHLSTITLSALLKWYIQKLEGYPLTTKALTTGCMQFVGDWAAQYYEKRRRDGKHGAYSLRRGLSLFADGLLLSGPLLHYCFEAMEHYLPTTADEKGGDNAGNTMNTTQAVLVHVLINDYIIDTVYIALSFLFTSVAEGYTTKEQLLSIFQKDYVATVTASWCTSLCFIPIEFLCFGYLPLHFRVLSMNFVDLLWGAIISFFSHRSRSRDTTQH